jgi:ubiquinone/menaquinone biosynthesis C-methylase UbiE
VAIDISKELLGIAKMKYQTVTFFEADMMNMDFPDESFDMVYSSLTFHYAQDWDALLKQVRRVLVRDGSLIFSTHNPDKWALKEKTGEIFKNQRGVLLTEHRDTLPSGVNIQYWNAESPTVIQGALHVAGFTIEIFDFAKVIDEQFVREDLLGKYRSLKEKNAQLPLFLVVRAKATGK